MKNYEYRYLYWVLAAIWSWIIQYSSFSQRCVRLVSYIASGLGPDILSRCAIVGSCNYHAHLVEEFSMKNYVRISLFGLVLELFGFGFN